MPYVSLDLETTGLDPEVDEIIEVAAVRFDATGVLDRYQSLVNPGKRLEYRIELLTGIDPADLASAPHFGALAPEIERFIGLDPIVGQNPMFDVGFLQRKGVQISVPAYDTFELASILLSGLHEHSLGAIADHLGIVFMNRHRAMADADAARAVFTALRAQLASSPPHLLADAERIASASNWQLRHLFQELATEHPRTPGEADEEAETLHGFIRPPAKISDPVVPSGRVVRTAPEESQRLIASRAAHAALLTFEDRPEQVQMAHAVGEAIAGGEQLIVEAGTGVGKSLAYLVPSALHAARNNARTVVSTNTINLQDQLVASDIPLARRILAEAGIDADDLRVAQLKGRGNYLCLLRWAAARRAAALSADEARVLVRMLFWLGRTDTGDRAELNLRRNEDPAWIRLSAQDSGCLQSQCAYVRDGTCFLHRAKRRAEAAHVLVVNHALLLSDIATGGNVLPEYQHLVVDEAHHLEDEATSQFGFTGGEGEITGWLDRLHTRPGRDRDGGLAGSVQAATRSSQQPLVGGAPQLQAIARTLAEAVTRARDRVPAFFRLLQTFALQHGSGGGEYDERLTLNRGMRVQPDWADIEAAWFETEERLAAAEGVVEELHAALLQADPKDVLDRDAIAAAAAELCESGQKLRRNVSRIIAEDTKDTICWLTLTRRDPSPLLSSAPLAVAETLKTRLFDPKESVVLTSATLSTDGDFGYIKQRLGLEEPQELLLGSPFDYRQSTLILTPSDMPEPSLVGYAAATQSAIIDLARASEGRALVLFTSHAALRTAYNGIKRPLEEQQILVLGQGIDGTPRQLLAALKGSHRTVVLGAASFWEGVDVTGEALSLLIMARLPFSVPSDPVFQARAELFDQPFEQYAVPQAILRFKQGFGRLIRRKTDRGVMVVLDRRLRSKQYGVSFLRSLPPCTLREAPLRELSSEVAAWLAHPTPVPGTPA
ncbi:MAG: hypothetical protein IVW36_04120 [Dehalococcoidia bacterium]|nr:hypothetical protein [Dehalococcoidia bacterium]